MVRKVRKYANGGQVKDYTSTGYRWPKPTYGEAVFDRMKEMVSGGAAGKAAKQVDANRRKKQIDDAVDSMDH